MTKHVVVRYLRSIPDEGWFYATTATICLGLLFAIWTVFGIATPGPFGALLFGIVFVSTIGLSWAALLLVTGLLVGRSWLAPAAATMIYTVLGLVYAVAEVVDAPGYAMGANEFGYFTSFWPVLFFWQDVCQLGLWACPA